MARTIRTSILPVLALGALLAGCAANPGTAAVIDGERMSEQDAQGMARELSELLGEPIATTQAILVYAQSEAVIQTAAESNVTITQSAVIDELDALAEMSGYEPEDGEYRDDTVHLMHGQFVGSALQADPTAAERLTERVAEIDIELSPRYGTVSGTDFLEPAPPWLVEARPAGS